ncbi:MAG: hypothetical protein Q6373_026010 [Candidatus Sigynarchaeota archaeon]
MRPLDAAFSKKNGSNTSLRLMRDAAATLLQGNDVLDRGSVLCRVCTRMRTDRLLPSEVTTLITKPPYQNCFSCPRKKPRNDETCRRCAEQSAGSAPRWVRQPAWLAAKFHDG